MKKKRVVIIGAGLSGLTSAVLLQERYDVTILEARDRTGGRIMGIAGHDMGPSWVWPHQKNILNLIETLGLELFSQYTQGLATYDAPEGVQHFRPSQTAPSYRIKGGISQLVMALEKRLETPVHLHQKVHSLTHSDKRIVVQTVDKAYEADIVISTLPPRLAVESIAYSPVLPDALHTQLQKIPTWMGYAAKCVIEYPDAFWREEGLSGFAVSHLGPLGEIHDACTQDKAALFGFVHSYAKYDNFEEEVIQQLTRLYGSKAALPSNFHLVDWKKEPYTSTPLDTEPLREHPVYGFSATHFGDRLIFSGTESALREGGYLDGAVTAAFDLVKHV
ncbi:FAD-dependent oxidoreductase [Sulfurovum sp. XGS-02]|uniref:flavin monoamine oxidase family protein n=1 Tax=Sulfurovum sp. XGS-02 TaxID=2925411 RepID=UPI00206329D4|nr:FAD-dependent oxidoreductase [Sulfurovum sp. XGS-02]UPT78277.1 FAD-dependent oxidoreductase [Sulfurovum sp. XGS-02]